MQIPSHAVRVVAGAAKGRLLSAPAGRATRPTSDRVREAVFSILTSMQAVEGSAVLDLFAGSGALGIEALSRGASSVTFVDSDSSAQAAIKANLAVVGDLKVRATVVKGDALRYCASAGEVDLVLADPPYEFASWSSLLSLLVTRTQTLVAETGSELDPGPAWETVLVRRYGGTVVMVARPAVRPPVVLRQEGEM